MGYRPSNLVDGELFYTNFRHVEEMMGLKGMGEPEVDSDTNLNHRFLISTTSGATRDEILNNAHKIMPT